jgi:hypothetical protein
MPDVFITDKTGNQLVELENANVSEVVWELNQAGSASFDIPVDDPKLTSYGAINLLNANQANGGEAGTTSGWVTFGTNVIASSTEQILSGTRSIKLTYQNDLRLSNMSPPLSLAAGEIYYLSFWIYIPATWTAGAVFPATDAGGGNEWAVLSIQPVDMTKKGVWQYCVYALRPPTTGNWNVLFRAVTATAGQFVYVDQLQVEKDRVTEWAAGGTTRPTIFYPRGAIDEIQIWEEDQLLWWGILESLSMNKSTLGVKCAGLLAYMFKRFVTNASLTYTSIDQFLIAWNLFLVAQTGADKDFNIDNATYANSGKTRSRFYDRAEHANMFDLLQEFPKLELGFDFEIEIDGTGQRLFHPYHPQKGSFKGAFPFEWGVNIDDFEGIEDFVEMANLAYATGGTSGDVKFEANYRDNAAAARDGEMQTIISEGSQSDVTELSEIAQKEVERRKDPVKLPTITTYARVPTDLLMNVFTGDTVQTRIDHGRAQFMDVLRVNKKTWKPSEEKIAWELMAA